jgi:hypothetical protein
MLFPILEHLLAVGKRKKPYFKYPQLQRHNKENPKQIFPGKELRGSSPNAYIHVSVSDLNVCIFL